MDEGIGSFYSEAPSKKYQSKLDEMNVAELMAELATHIRRLHRALRSQGDCRVMKLGNPERIPESELVSDLLG